MTRPRLREDAGMTVLVEGEWTGPAKKVASQRLIGR